MSIVQLLWRQYMRLKNPTCTIHAHTLARQVVLEKHVTIEQGCYIGAAHIGRCTFIGANSYIDKSTASIGRFCSIAMSARISLKNHPLDRVSTHPFTYSRKYGYVASDQAVQGVSDAKTTIGHDVWIGANVTVLAGVSIGNGAVLGANSVVTDDVAPYSIVHGTPARHVRYRFDEATIDQLQRSAWWDWDDERIRANIAAFRDPVGFLKLLKG
jgi:virginiamycin A acetyltransferase